MDYHSLDSAIQVYFAAALSPSIHLTYVHIRQQNVNIFYSNFYITPLPITEASLCYFVTCLGQQGLAHSTICTYLSGVRQFQISHGYKKFNYEHMPWLCQILKGMKTSQGHKSKKLTLAFQLPLYPSFNEKGVISL